MSRYTTADKERIFNIARQQKIFIVDGSEKHEAHLSGSTFDFPMVCGLVSPYWFQVSWALVERIAAGHTQHIIYSL